MEFKKATVFINYSIDYPIDTEIFVRAKNQRISSFIRSIRKSVFQKISSSTEDIFALIVYEGDVGKTYEKITKDDVLKSHDFDTTKFRVLRAYRHEAREDKK